VGLGAFFLITALASLALAAILGRVSSEASELFDGVPSVWSFVEAWPGAKRCSREVQLPALRNDLQILVKWNDGLSESLRGEFGDRFQDPGGPAEKPNV
jgi:hypothetical protein